MVSIQEYREDVDRTLDAIKDAATMYQEIAAQAGEIANVLAELQKSANLAKLAWFLSRLRSLQAGLIQQEMTFDKERLRMVEISQKVETLSSFTTEDEDPETFKASVEVRGMINQAKAGLEEYARIIAKFSVGLKALAESASLAYLEAQAETQRNQEERQRRQEEAHRKFERWMQRIGALIAVIVAIFTAVSTLKALGRI